MPTADRAPQRRRVAVGLFLALIGFGIWMLRPAPRPSAKDLDPTAPAGTIPDGTGPTTPSQPATRTNHPSILREAARTARNWREWPDPGGYELALVSRELAFLAELERTGTDVQRNAAQTVSGMLAARAAARAAFAGHTSNTATSENADSGTTQGAGLPPAELLALPGWKELGDLDAPHHPTFHQDARAELTRLGVPSEAHDYLLRFLLESVDEIEALSAAAYQTGPRLPEFPEAVTDANPPASSDPGVLAAWLMRQSTIRMLHEMGVAVDARFEHAILNAGIGTTVLPYRWIEAK
jgi:hypothetical protein